MRLGDNEEEKAFRAEEARREALRQVAGIMAEGAAACAGHSNLRQKIHHVQKLKDEVRSSFFLLLKYLQPIEV